MCGPSYTATATLITVEQGGYSAGFYIGIYAAISFGQAFMALINQSSFAVCTINAARSLHAGMFSALLAAPMSFHSATPIGRILNRFSKDTSDIDTSLQFALTLPVATLYLAVMRNTADQWRY